MIEVASWQLASELMRRHPASSVLLRGHPGDGQYDLLWIKGVPPSRLDIRLNRTGTIQVHGRADDGDRIDWPPTEWSDYLADHPRLFLERLELAAGWRTPVELPPLTPTTLTYCVLAALADSVAHSDRPVSIEQGFIDSSGDYGGPNSLLDEIPLPGELTALRPDDFYGEAGYRFWIPMRGGRPLAVLEQTSGTAWFRDGSEPLDLMETYRQLDEDPVRVAAEVLRRALP